uniref:Uncharacterized protein n=1 Tax=Romanomermis culicivorax TaxID=13658 RepID=A0A915JPQ5_ROMCU
KSLQTFLEKKVLLIDILQSATSFSENDSTLIDRLNSEFNRTQTQLIDFQTAYKSIMELFFHLDAFCQSCQNLKSRLATDFVQISFDEVPGRLVKIDELESTIRGKTSLDDHRQILRRQIPELKTTFFSSEISRIQTKFADFDQQFEYSQDLLVKKRQFLNGFVVKYFEPYTALENKLRSLDSNANLNDLNFAEALVDDFAAKVDADWMDLERLRKDAGINITELPDLHNLRKILDGKRRRLILSDSGTESEEHLPSAVDEERKTDARWQFFANVSELHRCINNLKIRLDDLFYNALRVPVSPSTSASQPPPAPSFADEINEIELEKDRLRSLLNQTVELVQLARYENGNRDGPFDVDHEAKSLEFDWSDFLRLFRDTKKRLSEMSATSEEQRIAFVEDMMNDWLDDASDDTERFKQFLEQETEKLQDQVNEVNILSGEFDNLSQKHPKFGLRFAVLKTELRILTQILQDKITDNKTVFEISSPMSKQLHKICHTLEKLQDPKIKRSRFGDPDTHSKERKNVAYTESQCLETVVPIKQLSESASLPPTSPICDSYEQKLSRLSGIIIEIQTIMADISEPTDNLELLSANAKLLLDFETSFVEGRILLDDFTALPATVGNEHIKNQAFDLGNRFDELLSIFNRLKYDLSLTSEKLSNLDRNLAQFDDDLASIRDDLAKLQSQDLKTARNRMICLKSLETLSLGLSSLRRSLERYSEVANETNSPSRKDIIERYMQNVEEIRDDLDKIQINLQKDISNDVIINDELKYYVSWIEERSTEVEKLVNTTGSIADNEIRLKKMQNLHDQIQKQLENVRNFASKLDRSDSSYLMAKYSDNLAFLTAMIKELESILYEQKLFEEEFKSINENLSHQEISLTSIILTDDLKNKIEILEKIEQELKLEQSKLDSLERNGRKLSDLLNNKSYDQSVLSTKEKYSKLVSKIEI